MDREKPSEKRRKPAFTKSELKTYSAAASDAGLDEWTVERQHSDGTVTRFICGGQNLDGQSDWDKHETR